MLSGRYLALVGWYYAVIFDYDMRCFWRGARAKDFFIGLSSNSPRWVGGALQEKTAMSNCVRLFLCVLVEHLKSEGDDFMELCLLREGSRFKMLGRCFLDSFGARARTQSNQK